MTGRKSLDDPVTSKFSERFARVYPASGAPIEELRDIHASLTDFAFVDPDVCYAQFDSQTTLRQVRRLPQAAQQPRKVTVSRRVLGLGHNSQWQAN